MKDYPMYGTTPTRVDSGWDAENRLMKQKMIKVPSLSQKMLNALSRASMDQDMVLQRIKNNTPIALCEKCHEPLFSKKDIRKKGNKTFCLRCKP